MLLSHMKSTSFYLVSNPHLGPGSVNNDRLVSNLSFYSKVVEREPLESAVRVSHSTEIALTKVVNDLLFNMDSDFTSVLLPVDFSAAFDTTDHCILLDC